MRTVVLIGVGALALAAVVWGGYSYASQACGPLDRSGCVASFTVANMTGLGDSIAIAPDTEGMIWVAGNHFSQGRNSGRTEVSMALALIDVATGTEVSRLSPDGNGTPVQLILSPDGSRMAIANSTIYVHSADLMMLDTQGETLWSHEFDEYDVVPNAEGYAFALAFGPQGELFADPLAFDAQGEPIEPQPVEHRWIESPSADVEWPGDFVPLTYATRAPSPDGTREAVLVRRFDRNDGIRAILEVREIGGGAGIVRHEIDEDLNAALVWDPLGRGVIVARAGAFDAGSGTQLRIYSAEAGQ